MTERALARRYIRESREPSELDAPTSVERDRRACSQGRCSRAATREVSGQIWCMAMDIGALPSRDRAGRRGRRRQPRRRAAGGDRARRRAAGGQQRHASRPTETLALAAERGVPVVASPLDSYVTARMITLSAPVPRADGPEAADRAPRRPALRRRRRGQGRPLPGGGRGRLCAGTRSASSPARTSSARARGACCWSTTPSRRRACRASSRPRSSRSSTTTTSARSRRRCRCGRRSTRSARPRRS